MKARGFTARWGVSGIRGERLIPGSSMRIRIDTKEGMWLGDKGRLILVLSYLCCPGKWVPNFSRLLSANNQIQYSLYGLFGWLVGGPISVGRWEQLAWICLAFSIVLMKLRMDILFLLACDFMGPCHWRLSFWSFLLVMISRQKLLPWKAEKGLTGSTRRYYRHLDVLEWQT